jgi:hypothetical protein
VVAVIISPVPPVIPNIVDAVANAAKKSMMLTMFPIPLVNVVIIPIVT